MLRTVIDFLKKNTGQYPVNKATLDETEWKTTFEEVLKRSESRPAILVEFARKGFPPTLRDWAWCRILRIDQVPWYLKDYEQELLRTFGRVDPTHFQAPCFGSPLDLTALKLSTSRLDTIKKLLCIVGNAHPQLEYTPVVPAIIAILSKFLEPNNVLACMAVIIEGHSIPASKRQDWAYFPLHRRDYLVFERVFEDLVKTFAPKAAKALNKMHLISANFRPAWDKILVGLFISILPRDLIMRIFDVYLVEGYKILLRFAIAHVIIRQDALISATTPEEFNKSLEEPVDESLGLTDLYFKTAMAVKFERSIIQRYRNRRRKHSLGDFDSEDKLFMFQRPLPHLNRPSSFMTDKDWATLWAWIPTRYRLLDLNLAYTSAEHGKHLVNLYSRCKESEPLLLLIETVSNSIAGVYISKPLITENGHLFYGTGETFLFSIKPRAAKYDWKIKSGNQSFICATDSFIAFGVGDDFGLWVDKFICQVTSAKSATFDNDPLFNTGDPEDLRIYCLEVFSFV